MTFNVKFTEDVKKFLKKLDKHTAKFILAWIRKNLEGCTNPRHTGKGLTSNRSGQWRYRVGDYRFIADIQEKELVILVIQIGHRSVIYKN